LALGDWFSSSWEQVEVGYDSASFSFFNGPRHGHSLFIVQSPPDAKLTTRKIIV
jgi:hypothetical protein